MSHLKIITLEHDRFNLLLKYGVKLWER